MDMFGLSASDFETCAPRDELDLPLSRGQLLGRTVTFDLRGLCTANSDCYRLLGFSSFSAFEDEMRKFVIPWFSDVCDNPESAVCYPSPRQKELPPLDLCAVAFLRVWHGDDLGTLHDRTGLSIGHLSRLVSTTIRILIRLWVPLYYRALADSDIVFHTPSSCRHQLADPTIFGSFGEIPPPELLPTLAADDFELIVEHPSDDVEQQAMSSRKLQHKFCTVKVLVLCCLDQFIAFISHPFGGGSSEVHPWHASGTLNDIALPGRRLRVVLDRGFKKLEVSEADVIKILPTFLHRRTQFEPTEIVSNREISSVRVVVEQAIRRILRCRVLHRIRKTMFRDVFDFLLIAVAIANRHHEIAEMPF